MQNLKTLSTLRLTMFILGSVLALGLIWPALATAQDLEPNLTSQLVELQGRVARLEAALKQNSNGMASDTPAQSDPAGTRNDTAGASAASGQGMGGDKSKGMGGGKGMGMMGQGGKGMGGRKGMGMMGQDGKGMGGGKAEMSGSTGQLMKMKFKIMEMKIKMMEMKMLELEMKMMEVK
tara:strand:+ start:102 stop:635 length:534 start_codon:yes stop_codon:yes gene_type:complete